MTYSQQGNPARSEMAGTSGWTQGLSDAASWAVSLLIGLVLVLHVLPTRGNLVEVLLLAAVAIVVQGALGSVVKLYQNRYWTGSLEEIRMVAAVMATAAIAVCLAALVMHLPITPAIVAAPFAACFAGATRYLRRLAVDRAQLPRPKKAKRTLVYGAGNLGRLTVQHMLADPRSPYFPVGFVDDDPSKRNLVVRNVPVLGSFHDLARINDAAGVGAIVVAIDTPPRDLLTRLVGLAPSLDVEVKVVPTLERSLGRQTLVGPVRDIRIEDLMEHHSAALDIDSMRGYLRGKRVLVTGAGGSIGQELCVQVRKLAPSALILLDHDETHLQDTEFLLYGTGLLMRDDIVLADIRDKAALCAVFERTRPDVVFHAAALKHVPMLERFPREAWDTNVLGTLNVLECARDAGVQTFINISTDKAAAPTTILGHSKRMAEHLTSWMGEHAEGRYVSVRFGNVFGSRGSMVPLFQKAIAQDRPLMITHEQATRYFMTIPEACELVIAAGAEGRSGDVMILEMGHPVRILDIAKRLVEMSGKSVPIEIVGIRPGEKVHEVLTSSEDGLADTEQSRGTIRGHVDPVDPSELDYGIWLATVHPGGDPISDPRVALGTHATLDGRSGSVLGTTVRAGAASAAVESD